MTCPNNFTAINGTCVASNLVLNILGINFAPQFIEDPSAVEIYLNRLDPPGEYIFRVPEYLDLNENSTESIIVNVKGLNETFMAYNEPQKLLEFKNIDIGKVGTHRINITLTDKERASTRYEIQFVIIDD